MEGLWFNFGKGQRKLSQILFCIIYLWKKNIGWSSDRFSLFLDCRCWTRTGGNIEGHLVQTQSHLNFNVIQCLIQAQCQLHGYIRGRSLESHIQTFSMLGGKFNAFLTSGCYQSYHALGTYKWHISIRIPLTMTEDVCPVCSCHNVQTISWEWYEAKSKRKQ